MALEEGTPAPAAHGGRKQWCTHYTSVLQTSEALVSEWQQRLSDIKARLNEIKAATLDQGVGLGSYAEEWMSLADEYPSIYEDIQHYEDEILPYLRGKVAENCVF